MMPGNMYQHIGTQEGNAFRVGVDGGGSLDISIMGPIEIMSGGSLVEIRGAIQCLLLVTLVVNNGRPRTSSVLIKELWDGSPPRNPENALQAHISRFRSRLKELEPDAPSRLMRSTTGYRLRFEPHELDANRFVGCLDEMRSKPDMPPDEAVRRLRETLQLWRGPVFDSMEGGSICRAAAARYEESRLSLLELLYDNELKLGRHAEIIPELRELIEVSGPNERLCEQLMVALYRAGRQTDALAVYRQMWTRLKDEIGIEPSPVLRRYERAILTHHPVLNRTADHLALHR